MLYNSLSFLFYEEVSNISIFCNLSNVFAYFFICLDFSIFHVHFCLFIFLLFNLLPVNLKIHFSLCSSSLPLPLFSLKTTNASLVMYHCSAFHPLLVENIASRLRRPLLSVFQTSPLNFLSSLHLAWIEICATIIRSDVNQLLYHPS